MSLSVKVKTMQCLVLRGVLAAGAVLAFATPTAVVAQAQEQYFGVPSSRVGPYSAMGTGYYGGIIDT
jgi:branched-chain amino acid transport system substrate-binding protein